MEAALSTQVPTPPTASSQTRPSREQVEAALADLLPRRGTEILGHARRFSASPEDAEDAYQRGLEIALKKAPSTVDDELVPWLKTVVKHEAFAIAHTSRRAGVPVEEALIDASSLAPAPEDQAERYERLRIGAEAIARLKPQEIRAMLLRAEGDSYAEIRAKTGWSHTKVDRCLKEGRKRFLQQVDGIESGAACLAIEPILSRFCDGEARAAEVLQVRAHLRRCAGCRATLADFRTAPARVAALTAPIAALAGAPHEIGGVLQCLHEQATGWLADKATLAAVKVQGAFEAAGAGKLAAAAASSVAIAGGGLATVGTLERSDARDQPRPTVARAEAAKTEAQPAVASPAPAPAPPIAAPEAVYRRADDAGDRDRRAPADRHGSPARPAPPAVAEEFAPSPSPEPAPADALDEAAQRPSGEGSGGGAGEFGM